MPNKIPVVFNYDYEEVIGRAKVDDNGEVHIQITDPRIIDLIQQDQLRLLKALSISHTPAIPKKHPYTPLPAPTDQLERDAHFKPGNDSIWGEGNWIRCPTCPRDSAGFEVYHHKDAHS